MKVSYVFFNRWQDYRLNAWQYLLKYYDKRKINGVNKHECVKVARKYQTRDDKSYKGAFSLHF